MTTKNNNQKEIFDRFRLMVNLAIMDSPKVKETLELIKKNSMLDKFCEYNLVINTKKFIKAHYKEEKKS
jgi:hypothetical protein